MASHDKLSLVRVEAAMHTKLKRAADKADRTITDEVKVRLDASFEREADAVREPKFAELQRQVAELAGSLELETEGPWHSDPFAFQTFRAGILALLDAARPAGEPTPPNEGSGRIFGINDPEALGRAFAGLVRHGKSTGGKP
jgi:hypothetical protein